MDRQIVALGGGDLGRDDGRCMQRYLLDLTGHSDPRICLIPTATGERARSPC